MKGVLHVSFEAIEKQIQENAGLPFEMDNGAIMMAWDVAVVDDDLFARRTAWLDGKDEDPYIDYFQVSYRSLDAQGNMCADDIYELIVEDFILCYGEDLYCGSANGLSLFGEFAGPEDEGLAEMLDIFMKSYGEFLQDVFLYFGEWLDEQLIVIEPGELEEPKSPAEVAQIKEARLVRKALERYGKDQLELGLPDDSIVRWTFAKVNGEIWYEREDYWYEDGDVIAYATQYGVVDPKNPDSIDALKDVLFALTAYGGVKKYPTGDPFGLIGISPEDLVDED